MKILDLIQKTGFAEALATAVLHSLWQGLVIGLIVLFVIVSVKKLSSKMKYAIAYAGLIITIAFFGVTFFATYEPANKHEFAENAAKSGSQNELTSNGAQLKNVAHLTLLNPSAERIDKITSNQTLVIGIAFLWVIGVLFFVLKFFGEYVYISRLKRNFRNSKASSLLNETTNKLSKQLKIKAKVKVLQSAVFKVPSVIGFFKPIIILPIGLVNGLTSEQVEAVIMHELAHIKRKDYFMNIIQKIIEIVMFYHPVVWILSAYIRDEREKCCDDIVIDSLKNKKDYAFALGYVQMHAFNKKTSFAMQLAGSKNKILYRMKRIVEKPYRKTKRFEGFLAAFLLVVGAAAVILSTSSFTSNYAVEKEQDDTIIVKRTKKVNLVFSDTVDEELKKIDVTLEDNEIEDLFVNGKKIKEKHYPKFEKVIAKRVDKVEEEKREVVIEKKVVVKENNEIFIDETYELEDMQERMTELSKQISERVKDIDFEEAFDEDVVGKIENFGIEMGKLGAEIGLKVAEAFQNIQWDSLGIEIDEEDMEEMREDLKKAREDIKKDFMEAEVQRKAAKEQKQTALEQKQVAEKYKQEAEKQKQIALEQQRIAEKQMLIDKQQKKAALENEQKANETLQKEIEMLKKELEEVKKELEKQKEK